MPRPTNTEIIRDLDRGVAKLDGQVANNREDISLLVASHVKLAEALTKAETRLTVAETRLEEWKKTWEARFEDMKKAQEETDRRRWQVLALFIGSLLTLVVNILVALFRK